MIDKILGAYGGIVIAIVFCIIYILVSSFVDYRKNKHNDIDLDKQSQEDMREAMRHYD